MVNWFQKASEVISNTYNNCNTVIIQRISNKEFKEQLKTTAAYMSVRWCQIKSGKYTGAERFIRMGFTIRGGSKIAAKKKN